jgi:hypothetical protein
MIDFAIYIKLKKSIVDNFIIDITFIKILFKKIIILICHLKIYMTIIYSFLYIMKDQIIIICSKIK